MDAPYGYISLFINYYMKMRARLPKVGIARYVKGVPFFNKRYMKGVPFLPKWYIKGLGLGPRGGASPC